jgi:hypothetical protein
MLYFERLANLMLYHVRPANLVLNIEISPHNLNPPPPLLKTSRGLEVLALPNPLPTDLHREDHHGVLQASRHSGSGAGAAPPAGLAHGWIGRLLQPPTPSVRKP